MIREVFAQIAGAEAGEGGEAGGERGVVFGGVVVQRLIGPAVEAAVGLFVAGKAVAPEPQGVGDRALLHRRGAAVGQLRDGAGEDQGRHGAILGARG
ncbi:hypothetical protein OPU71_15355 [Niveibacterium sp. 24ML]|uniref:hypothetical protein n=1 Tax=Niveibacterium sp. 24ML TaxID=2985512 RepID=UPI00226FE160|nr:hypothetical protein [Niveibacterium sp. 24ML]MCX9157504.1 hypothetical protein [Niveibacterium sp. 24ML]